CRAHSPPRPFPPRRSSHLGIELLVDTGLADHILPELPAMKLEIDEHHQHKDVYRHSLKVLEQAIDLEQADSPDGEPDLVLRLARSDERRVGIECRASCVDG